MICRSKLRRITLLAAAANVLVVSCSSTRIGAVVLDGRLALGTWGGDNAGMIVSDSAMHLHIGCTFGDVSGRIPVTSDGTFNVPGSYMLRAFPIARGPSLPARFVGQLDGITATVTVTVDDTVERKTVVLGPAVVKYGEQPRTGPCPICRRPILTRLDK